MKKNHTMWEICLISVGNSFSARLIEIVHNIIWTFKIVALLQKSHYALRGSGPHHMADAATAVPSPSARE